LSEPGRKRETDKTERKRDSLSSNELREKNKRKRKRDSLN